MTPLYTFTLDLNRNQTKTLEFPGGLVVTLTAVEIRQMRVRLGIHTEPVVSVVRAELPKKGDEKP